MDVVLDILGISQEGLAFAWTFRSKGTRYFDERDQPVLADGKPLTIGRRCAMYIRLPCSVPALRLEAGSYLGVVGDVSTQSTNVSTAVYFLVIPRTEKIWAIIGVLDVARRCIDCAGESVKRAMDTAMNRSRRLRENRAEARRRNAAASGESASRPAPVSRNVQRAVVNPSAEKVAALPPVPETSDLPEENSDLSGSERDSAAAPAPAPIDQSMQYPVFYGVDSPVEEFGAFHSDEQAFYDTDYSLNSYGQYESQWNDEELTPGSMVFGSVYDY